MKSPNLIGEDSPFRVATMGMSELQLQFLLTLKSHICSLWQMSLGQKQHWCLSGVYLVTLVRRFPLDLGLLFPYYLVTLMI